MWSVPPIVPPPQLTDVGSALYFVDQVLEGLQRRVGLDHDHFLLGGQGGDRRGVGDRDLGLVQGQRADHHQAGDHQRVRVLAVLGDQLGDADRAAGAGHVDHRDGPAGQELVLLDHVLHLPGGQVPATAGGGRHHDLDVAAREVAGDAAAFERAEQPVSSRLMLNPGEGSAVAPWWVPPQDGQVRLAETVAAFRQEVHRFHWVDRGVIVEALCCWERRGMADVDGSCPAYGACTARWICSSASTTSIRSLDAGRADGASGLPKTTVLRLVIRWSSAAWSRRPGPGGTRSAPGSCAGRGCQQREHGDPAGRARGDGRNWPQTQGRRPTSTSGSAGRGSVSRRLRAR